MEYTWSFSSASPCVCLLKKVAFFLGVSVFSWAILSTGLLESSSGSIVFVLNGNILLEDLPEYRWHAGFTDPQIAS